MQSAAPIILQAGQRSLGESFPLKKYQLMAFSPQKKKKKTKCIFAEKLNDYLGQYKFEA